MQAPMRTGQADSQARDKAHNGLGQLGTEAHPFMTSNV